MQPYIGEPEVQGCGDDLEEEEEGAEDVGLEAGVNNLGDANQLPLVRDKETWSQAQVDQPPRRPSLLSHLSHLSITSTETTEGNSSEGHTFSVNSQESGFKLHLSTTSSSAPNDTHQLAQSESKDGEFLSEGSHSGTRDAPALPHSRTSSSALAQRYVPASLSPSDSELPLETANIPRTPRDGKDPSSGQNARLASPASDGSGTVFAGMECEPEKSIIAQPVESRIPAFPAAMSSSTNHSRRPSYIQEVRREDAIHDWRDEKETEEYRQVYEHRKEIKERSCFRPPGVTSREAQDHSSFSAYLGSGHNRFTKGKERDRLPADDFDMLQEDFSPSEGRSGRIGLNERDRSPQSHTSSEQERAQFDAAIQARQKIVQFQPRTFRSRNSAKAAESSSLANPPNRGQQHQHQSTSTPSQNPSASRHSPRFIAHESKQSLSRRPSAKRAQSHVMSWDMALLSPAPQNDLVEENQHDRESKAMGSVRFAGNASCESVERLDFICEHPLADSTTATTGHRTITKSALEQCFGPSGGTTNVQLEAS